MAKKDWKRDEINRLEGGVSVLADLLLESRSTDRSATSFHELMTGVRRLVAVDDARKAIAEAEEQLRAAEQRVATV